MTTVAIIQARMTSTRLPGKVLAEIEGRPLLAYMVARVRRAKTLDSIWVATTTNAEDDPVALLCRELGVSVHRGDEADVLGRYAGAAAASGAKTIVRLTADCPFIDPVVIDDAVRRFHEEKVDYLSNAIALSFPDGLDVEVMRRDALETADREADLPFHREHVTPFLRSGVYENVPTGDFRVGFMRAPADFSHLRWTVDTPEDLARLRRLAAHLPDDFGWLDAVALLTRRPELLGGGMAADETIELRPVRESDADLLLEWVNRPESLAGKIKTRSPISRETHCAWLRGRLASPDAGIWIAERDGEPVGQVRAERSGTGGDALEVDIFVIPEARGRGAGLAMLERLAEACAERWPGALLVARIRPDNWTSRRLFARAGFGEVTVAPDHLIYRRRAGR